MYFAAMTLAGCAFQEKRVRDSRFHVYQTVTSQKVIYASWNRKKLVRYRKKFSVTAVELSLFTSTLHLCCC